MMIPSSFVVLIPDKYVMGVVTSSRKQRRTRQIWFDSVMEAIRLSKGQAQQL